MPEQCALWGVEHDFRRGIPIVRETLDVIEPVLAKFDGLSRDDGLEKTFSPAREANFAAQVIRELLRAGAMEKIRHEL